MTQIDYLIINDMTKLGNLVVGKKNQITIMGILNISPESFYKKSIKSTKSEISNTCQIWKKMELILLTLEGCLPLHI